MEETDHPQRFAALRYRNFAALFSGLLVSNVGTWMQNVALAWLVFELTRSPLWLGFLGLSFALPMTIIPLFSGTIIDRVHRIRLLYVTQTGAMLIAFVLAALTYLHVISVWYLLAGSFLGATLLAFDNPARQALVPDLVPPSALLNAVSLNAATYNGAALVGPAIAGVVLAQVGAVPLFLLNAFSFLAVIVALASMRDVKTHSGTHHASLGHSLREGFAFVAHNRLVFALLGLSALSALFGRSYQNLLPTFSALWHGGSAGYGLLLSAAGAGALIGAFALAYLREVRNQNTVMVGAGLVFSASIVAFALSGSLALGIAFMFIAGVSSTVFGSIVATYIQLSTPGRLRGRVMSYYAITLIGLPSLGVVFVGALAEALGGVRGAPRAVLAAALVLGVILLATAPWLLRVCPAAPEEAPR